MISIRQFSVQEADRIKIDAPWRDASLDWQPITGRSKFRTRRKLEFYLKMKPTIERRVNAFSRPRDHSGKRQHQHHLVWENFRSGVCFLDADNSVERGTRKRRSAYFVGGWWNAHCGASALSVAATRHELHMWSAHVHRRRCSWLFLIILTRRRHKGRCRSRNAALNQRIESWATGNLLLVPIPSWEGLFTPK